MPGHVAYCSAPWWGMAFSASPMKVEKSGQPDCQVTRESSRSNPGMNPTWVNLSMGRISAFGVRGLDHLCEMRMVFSFWFWASVGWSLKTSLWVVTQCLGPLVKAYWVGSNIWRRSEMHFHLSGPASLSFFFFFFSCLKKTVFLFYGLFVLISNGFITLGH